MKVTRSETITLKPYGNSTVELTAVLSKVPPAFFNLSFSKGDRPFDSDSYTMTISWETEVP